LLRDVLGRFGLRWRADHPSVLDPRGARLVLVESPANPTLELTDLVAAAARCKEEGALLAVDNTFLTPALQLPLELGADYSVYSTTKYIEGHNSTVGGAITGRDLEAVRFVQNAAGIGQKPWEAWLTLRGLKTLPVRMQRHSANARAVASFLDEHPRVRSVRHPLMGEQADLARRQQLGGGGMVAFEVEGDAVAVMNNLRLCSLAENLGAVETLVTHPATMTHACVPREERIAAGIPDGLVRLSVGLEDAADICADLEEALSCA
jgi:cystathionine beta-lyase/cystathionine gamma-synthase